MTINECIRQMQNGSMTAEQAAEKMGERSYAVKYYSPAVGEWSQYRAICEAHKKMYPEKRQTVIAVEVEMTRCSCGHTIPAGLVMSASMGSSCPDCYDRMSD